MPALPKHSLGKNIFDFVRSFESLEKLKGELKLLELSDVDQQESLLSKKFMDFMKELVKTDKDLFKSIQKEVDVRGGINELQNKANLKNTSTELKKKELENKMESLSDDLGDAYSSYFDNSSDPVISKANAIIQINVPNDKFQKAMQILKQEFKGRSVINSFEGDVYSDPEKEKSVDSIKINCYIKGACPSKEELLTKIPFLLDFNSETRQSVTCRNFWVGQEQKIYNINNLHFEEEILTELESKLINIYSRLEQNNENKKTITDLCR